MKLKPKNRNLRLNPYQIRLNSYRIFSGCSGLDLGTPFHLIFSRILVFVYALSLFSWPRVVYKETRLYVQVGTKKERRTERDVQVKIIFLITPCKASG